MSIDYVGIDPSLSCTAIVINNEKFVFVNADIALTKKGEFTKWFDRCSSYCDIKTYEIKNYKLYEYSAVEIYKLQAYDKITDDIISVIKQKTSSKGIVISMEGYSYSALAGPLIDLVGFSTVLRLKILRNVTNDLIIIPPSTLKLEAAKMAYTPIKKGKNLYYRNNEGLRGGKFKKREMLLSLLDIPFNNDPWLLFLNNYRNELLTKKSIPKPIDDINDALLLYRLRKQ